MGSSQCDIRLLPVQNAGLNQEPQGPIFEAWNTWTLKLLFGTIPWVRNLHFQHTSPGISQHTWPSSTFSLNFQACSPVGKWQTGLGVFNKRRSKKWDLNQGWPVRKIPSWREKLWRPWQGYQETTWTTAGETQKGICIRRAQPRGNFQEDGEYQTLGENGSGREVKGLLLDCLNSGIGSQGKKSSSNKRPPIWNWQNEREEIIR